MLNCGLCSPSRPQGKIERKREKKKDKYLDLARQLKKQWNMKVVVITIVIGALSLVNKALILGLEDLEMRGRGESKQSTELLRSTRVLRRVIET